MFNKEIINELILIKGEYPYLKQEVYDSMFLLKGKIEFYLLDPRTEKPPIKDKYFVEIKIFSDFPESIPIVKEIGGKIKQPYEHVSQTGILCLGIQSELYQLLKKYPTIKGFIEKIVKPNLFAYSFFNKYGYMPWRDRPAGQIGIYLRYIELFHTSDIKIILKFIEIVMEGNYIGGSECPCGSGKSLNECHGKYIFSLWQIPWNYLILDYNALIDVKLYQETSNILFRKFLF